VKNKPASNNKVANLLDRGNRGWIKVSDDDKSFYIPYGTQIELLRNGSYRINEGIYQGKIVYIDFESIKPKLFTSYLSSGLENKPAVKMSLIQSQQKIYLPTTYKFYSIVCNNLPNGTYKIMMPDHKHTDRMSTDYYNEHRGGSRFCETWFPLVLEKGFTGQYLHFGTFSEGCVTVTEDWNEIYINLILSRLDSSSVGELTVVS
jgi:hypothetical protein